MSNIPVSGRLIDLTVSQTGSQLHQLFNTGMRFQSGSATWTGSNAESTAASGSGVVAMEYTSGLVDGTVDFTGQYPKSSPKFGTSMGITFASGYVQRPKRFALELSCPEIDVTAGEGSATTYRSYIPSGIYSWTAEWVAQAVDSPVYSHPTAPNSQGSSATFKLAEDGSDDPSFAGSIIVERASHPFTINGQQLITYAAKGSGALQNKKGSSLPGLFINSTTLGNIVPPEWDYDADGVADGVTVLQYATGRTFTGNSFWTRLRVECSPDSIITVTGTLRFTGSVTSA